MSEPDFPLFSEVAIPAAGTGRLHCWSPWGSGNPAEALPGFNGERPDPVSGSYHLGNGYRAYNPLLMRFNCPDSLSPFGAGGINPYAYCAGDPVNHTDPSGHISPQGIIGIIAGIFGLGLSIFTAGASVMAAGSVAAAVSSASTTALVVGGLGVLADVTGIVSGAMEDVNPAASSVLGWVSMATGLAGMASGAALSPRGVRALRRHKALNAAPIVEARNDLGRQPPFPLNDLPDVALYQVLSYLPENDVINLGKVNQRFSYLARSELHIRLQKEVPYIGLHESLEQGCIVWRDLDAMDLPSYLTEKPMSKDTYESLMGFFKNGFGDNFERFDGRTRYSARRGLIYCGLDRTSAGNIIDVAGPGYSIWHNKELYDLRRWLMDINQ